jgi:hypothetical protein
MEPLYDNLRQAAVDYAAALNAYAATIAAQVGLTSSSLRVNLSTDSERQHTMPSDQPSASPQQCFRM